MFDLRIYTPSKVIGTFQVQSVQIPGANGQLGIGSHHAPFVSKMNFGILTFETTESKVHRYYISGGIAHVDKNNLDLLVEIIESPQDIDKERALRAQKRAFQRLNPITPEINIPRALNTLERSRLRLLVLEQAQDTRRA